MIIERSQRFDSGSRIALFVCVRYCMPQVVRIRLANAAQTLNTITAIPSTISFQRVLVELAMDMTKGATINHKPRMALIQLSPGEVSGFAARIHDRMSTITPTIMLFHIATVLGNVRMNGAMINQTPSTTVIQLNTFTSC